MLFTGGWHASSPGNKKHPAVRKVFPSCSLQPGGLLCIDWVRGRWDGGLGIWESRRFLRLLRLGCLVSAFERLFLCLATPLAVRADFRLQIVDEHGWELRCICPWL